MAITPWKNTGNGWQTREVDGIPERRAIMATGYDPFNVSQEIKDRELSANKQNDLSEDGTGVKYPTVDAVNNAFDKKISIGLISGNSTIASYLGQNAVSTYLLSTGDELLGNTITDISVPGNTIDQQKTLWLADDSKNSYDYIIVEIGLNDVNPAEAASVAMSRYQDYINSVNTYRKPGSKLIIGTMTPCRQRLIDLYGAVDGVTSYNKWLLMNESIMGGGTFPISGVDSRINTHTEALNDGLGNLASPYDMGDGVHENNIARTIIAASYRAQLAKYGLLKSSNSVNITNYVQDGLKVNTPILGSITGFANSETLNTILNRNNTSAKSMFITGAENIPTSGQGLTLYYTGGQSTLLSYDYGGSVYKPLNLNGSVINTNSNLNVTGKATISTAPTNPTDAVRKQELDLKAPLASPVFTGNVTVSVAEYADNAAAIAGGLTTGKLYRTGDILKVVH